MSYAVEFRGAMTTITLHGVTDHRADVRRPYYARGRGGVVGYGSMRLRFNFSEAGAYVEGEKDSSGPLGTLSVDELADDAGVQEAPVRAFAASIGDGPYRRRPTRAERIDARRLYGSLTRELLSRVGALDVPKLQLLVAASIQIDFHLRELDAALTAAGIAPDSPAATEHRTALVAKYDSLLYCVRDVGRLEWYVNALVACERAATHTETDTAGEHVTSEADVGLRNYLLRCGAFFREHAPTFTSGDQQQQQAPTELLAGS